MVSIQKDVSLKNFSNYKIGGRAKYFLEVSDLSQLIYGLREWEKIRGKDSGGVFILGGGTNVLISDKGFGGLVICNKIKNIESQRAREPESQIVRVGAGVLMGDLLNFCVQNCLSGLEWAGGLPGTLGGAIRGNAGAFRGEIKDVIVQIVSIASIVDRKGNFAIKTRNKAECRFGYRNSIFKTNPNEIIISATLKLQKGDKKLIEEKIEEKINYRMERHPLEYPNIGSIFKNIPARLASESVAGRPIEKVPQQLLEQLKDSIKNDPFPLLPTAKLLALAGLKGKRAGGAMVSQKHPNFIVNQNNASSNDVITLIEEIKKIIKDKYGIELEEEISYLH